MKTFSKKRRRRKTSVAAPCRVLAAAAQQATRQVWDNPIIWREIRTWAYGRKVLAIRLAYLLLAALSALGLHAAVSGGSPDRGAIALALAPILVLSLILVNALAVTSITTERDLGALDLLLVTDLTPAEFLFGKLGGVFYVAKEMVVLPAALCIYLWWRGRRRSRISFISWRRWRWLICSSRRSASTPA